jgi:hypothetical protein
MCAIRTRTPTLTGDHAMPDEQDAGPAERLENDPLDRMEPDDGDDEDVERAWEQTDVEEGEAPSG